MSKDWGRGGVGQNGFLYFISNDDETLLKSTIGTNLFKLIKT